MSAQQSLPDPSGHDWPSLLRRLRASASEDDLGAILDELSAEQARRRDVRFETAIARARAAAERGELQLALIEAETACGIDPVRWEAHRTMGEILERSGDLQAALRRYVTAVHLGWESDEAMQAVQRLNNAA